MHHMGLINLIMGPWGMEEKMSGRCFNLAYKPIKLKLFMILIKKERIQFKQFSLLGQQDEQYDIKNIDFVIWSPTLRCYRKK